MAVLLAVLLARPGAAQGAGFPAHEIERSLRIGLDAIQQRYIEPVAAETLALWALRGLGALDPALQAGSAGSILRLSVHSRIAAERPAAGGPAALSALFAAAWDASEPVRRAGADGLLRAAFEEVFNHLDPYSRYVGPAEAQRARQRRSGGAGFGLRLEASARGLAVAEVSSDGPAARAGLRPGDLILSIDGEPMRGEDLDLAESVLTASAEASIRVVLQRGRERRGLRLSRTGRPPASVVAERHAGHLLLRVAGFSTATGEQMDQALRRAFAARPPRGVILDLRGNRGGVLQQALAVAEGFLGGGPLARTDGRHPDARRTWEAAGADLARGAPVAVLVDGRTASSAEIVAAILSDRGRAVAVGSATMGKGLIQIVVPLPDGGELLLSWSQVLAPSGWPVQGLGVIPALCTSLGTEGTERILARLAAGDSPIAPVLSRQRAARPPVSASEVAALRGACPPAEGRDADLAAAAALLSRPAAYEAARLR